MIVPPSRFQEPVAAVKASVVPVLSNVPTRFTVPPLRLIVPSAASVNSPPRFTVLLVAVIVPAFDHAVLLFPRFSVAPVALIVEPAALVQPALSVKTSAAVAVKPWFTV